MGLKNIFGRIDASVSRASETCIEKALGDHMLIFLHIPKTAGETFRTRVSNNLLPRQTLSLYGIERTSEQIADHVSSLGERERDDIRFVCGHQVWYGIHDLFRRPPLYITFLRNPIARVISDYYKALRTPRNMFHEALHAKKITLAEWIAGEVTPMVKNHMTVFLSRRRADGSHNAAECNGVDEETVRRAIGNLRRFWYVGLTESFDMDLALVEKVLALARTSGDANVAPIEQKRSRLGLPLELLVKCAKLNWADTLVYSESVLLHEYMSRTFETARRGMGNEVVVE